MAIRSIIVAPDARLRQRSTPVTQFDAELEALTSDMLETMYAANGIGLAAVQLGVLKRVIVVDTGWGSQRYEASDHPAGDHNEDGGTRRPLVLVNPEVVTASQERSRYDEGCLSFPGQYSEVERPSQITVRYQDLKQNWHTLEADGLLATCIQHEIDHMEGVVFVDHISRVKRDMIVRKVKKARRQQTLEAGGGAA